MHVRLAGECARPRALRNPRVSGARTRRGHGIRRERPGLAIKRKLGKLTEVSPLARNLAVFVREAIDAYLFEVPISTRHAVVAADLPLHHRDSFDRLLAAQAPMEDLFVVSPDPAFGPYQVTRRRD